MTTQAAEKVAHVMLQQNRARQTFEVNFTDVETCKFMAQAFKQLGCEAEVVDSAWCLVRVSIPEAVKNSYLS